ncbi:MAG: hypothetical protein WB770_02495, partial [Acidimicrobiales bacterium]
SLFINGTCNGTAAWTETVSLNHDGSVPNSNATAALAAGNYSFHATYSGDSNYPMAASECEWFSVSKAASGVSTTVDDASTNSSWSGSETTGASAYDTSRVTGQVPGFNASGTVTYSFFTNGSCNGTPAWTQTVTLNPDGSVPNSNATGSLGAGSYSFDATYSGDSNYRGAWSPCCETFSVGQGTAKPVTQVDDASTNSAWSGSETTGASAYDTATIDPTTGGTTPTGTVTYAFFTNGTCNGTPAWTQTVTLNTDGSVPNSNATGSLGAGSYSFDATYSGDSNYPMTASDCEPFSVGQGTAKPVTQVDDASTNGAWSGSETTGASAYDTATIDPTTGGTTPTGTVTYDFYPGDNCAGELEALDPAPIWTQTVTLNPDGSVPNSNATGSLGAGSYSFDATYSGDSNYSGTTSQCEPFSVGQGTSATTTAVYDATTNAPWSGTENTGASAYDTASVTKSGGITATGSVTYTFFSNGTCTGTGSPAGGGALVNGAAPNSNTEGPLNAGNYSFLASYSGDDNHSGSTSTCEPFSVGVAATTTATTASTSSVTLATGNTVTDSATVSGPTPGTGLPYPTGTVTFYVCLVSSSTGQSGTCAATAADLVPSAGGVTNPVTLGSGSGDSNSANSPAFQPTAAGSYCFSAIYSGDTNYAGSFDNASGTAISTECLSVTLPPAPPIPPAPPKGSPKLSVSKDSVPKPGSIVKLGLVVEYLLKLTNPGNADATGINVIDHVPTGTTYVNGSADCHGATSCTASEHGRVVSWTGISLAAGASVTVSFKVTVDRSDSNNQVISNAALFSNKGTPSCSGSTCNTNTVKVKVTVPLPKAVPKATKPHTGEPWAGSRPYEIAILVLGAGLLALGERARRRMRRAARRA